MKERIKHFILLIILIGVDQGSKFWVKNVLEGNDPIVIIPDVFKLQYHENNGAVWGILSGKVDFLKIFTLLILLLIIFLYIKIPQGKKYNPLKIIAVFIIAGAVGNLTDRIFLGYVVDFIYFELINFPLFNIADSYLTVSSALLFVLALFYYKDEDFAFLDQLFKKKKNTVSDKEEDNTDEGLTSSDTEDFEKDENKDNTED